MNAMKQEAPERQEIEELLPWHAAGTLSRRDAQRVEDALANDPELARRYALVREELGETIRLNETLGAPSARALEKLFAKIDAEPARRQAESLNLGSRIGEFFASLSPRTLAWSASAAAIAILLQAGLLADIMLKETKTVGYETASAPTTDPGVGAFTLIRFAPQAIVGRHHKIPRSQQAVDCGGADGRRIVQGPRRGDRNSEGRTRQYREEAAARQSRRLHCHDRVRRTAQPSSEIASCVPNEPPCSA